MSLRQHKKLNQASNEADEPPFCYNLAQKCVTKEGGHT